jgi:hypothetical protein
MRQQNDPAHRGEAVECLRAGDMDGSSKNTVRTQFLRGRHGVPNRLAGLLAPLVWEEPRG